MTNVVLTEILHKPQSAGHVSAIETVKDVPTHEPVIVVDTFEPTAPVESVTVVPPPKPDPVPCPFCGVPGGSHRRTCASPFRG